MGEGPNVAPIILGNAPSSGSSVLRAILARHPSIACGGELCIMNRRRLFHESSESYRRNILRWLRTGYPNEFLTPGNKLFDHFEDYPWNENSLRELCRSADSFPELLRLLERRYVRARRRKRWLEKTPSNIFCFQEIGQVFPKAKFVHIVRDGRDCVSSLLRRRWSPFRAVSHWYYATLTGVQYRQWENYYELRYEDLVKNSERELRRLCEFLGEAWTSRLLEAQPARSTIKIESWKSSAYDAINAKSVAVYRSELSDTAVAMFQRVRLTVNGKRWLAFRGGTTGVLSPVQLQEYLGYETDRIDQPVRLDASARCEARREVFRWRRRNLSRYWRWLSCPTRIT